ncbi:MAG: hypothetical protein ACE5KE_04520 [Methanosarcinales archaeon]
MPKEIIKPIAYSADESREIIRNIAKTLGLELKKVTSKDLERVRKILSVGQPLSKIVIESREQ